jgi:hypothetical protein
VADVTNARVVERGEVAVLFKRVSDEQTAISRGWAEVEEAVGSLRGRKFYGVFDEAEGEYRVCVQLREGDDADALGLETGMLPGGRTRRSDSRAIRLPSTSSSRQRSRAWRRGRTGMRAVRGSSSTDGTTSSICFCPLSRHQLRACRARRRRG